MRYVWAVLLGLGLGAVLRRARAEDVVPPTAAPPRESVEAALTRQEIRALKARLAERKEEERRASTPPAPPPKALTLAEELREEVRKAGKGTYILDQRLLRWLNEEPARMGQLLGWVMEELRAGGQAEYLEEFLNWSLIQEEPAVALVEWVWASQESEADPTKRRLLLKRLAQWKSKPTAERARVLAAGLPGMSDPALRQEATTALLTAGPEWREAVLDSLKAMEAPEGRAKVLTAAWERRGGALGMSELRALTRAEMAGARPGWMIERSELWVPKYLSPFAPRETVALFAGTLRKADVDPFHKSISLMVIGSVASIFPGRPGRAEIEAAAAGADDERLRAFASKVVELLDQGKTYAELRQLDPRDFGLQRP